MSSWYLAMVPRVWRGLCTVQRARFPAGPYCLASILGWPGREPRIYQGACDISCLMERDSLLRVGGGRVESCVHRRFVGVVGESALFWRVGVRCRVVMSCSCHQRASLCSFA